MRHRQRAQERLARHVPALRERTERAPWDRLVERADAEPSPERAVLGASLRVREPSKARLLKGPEAGPNAPLLMRIVRHPFALAPVRWTTVRHRDEPGARPRPEARPGPLAYRDEQRESRTPGNPMLVFAHRPAYRRPPFLTARRAAEAVDE